MKRMHKSALGAIVVGAGAVVALNTPIIAQPGAGRDQRDNRAERNNRSDRNNRSNRGPSDEGGSCGERGESKSNSTRGDERARGDERGPRREHPPHPPGPSVEQLDEIANLTPEQEKKVAAVLESSRAQMERIHQETRKQIDSILTSEQRQKLQQMRDRMGPPDVQGGPPPGAGFGPPPGDRFGPPPGDDR